VSVEGRKGCCMTVEALRNEEKQLLKQFKARAAQIQAGNPEMTKESALTRAIAALPEVYDQYAAVRSQLQGMRVLAIPFDQV
jgi:hypothetical protein